MIGSQTTQYLVVTITSPANGSRVTGLSLKVTGTARALRETDDIVQNPSPLPESPEEGLLPPSGPIDTALPGASDDFEDVTAQIDRVEVKVDTGAGNAEFHLAEPIGPADRPWSEWNLTASLPRFFRQANITARVALGNTTDATSVHVFGKRLPILARS